MPYQLFQIPLPGPGDLRELNAYLATHRVVAVEKHLISGHGNGLLVFLVQTVDGAAPPASAADSGKKVDYKAELTPAQFAVFSTLREERKRLAEAEGVPVYAVFTNDQLAAMVRQPMHTVADLARIPGIGKARLEKHAASLLAILNPPAPQTTPS